MTQWIINLNYMFRFFHSQLRKTGKLDKIKSKSNVGMEALYSTYFPSETYNGKCNEYILQDTVVICN